MSFELARCTKHGHYMPCMECLISEGWEEARENAERARRAVADSDGPEVRDLKPSPPPPRELGKEIPGSMKHQAATMIETSIIPMQQLQIASQLAAQQASDTTYPWMQDDLGRWRVDLGLGMELALYGDMAVLMHCTVVVLDKTVSGTEVEKKAAAVALAAEFGMRFLSRLPFITG